MNHTISGKILAKESRFPRSEIFFATLPQRIYMLADTAQRAAPANNNINRKTTKTKTRETIKQQRKQKQKNSNNNYNNKMTALGCDSVEINLVILNWQGA